ncbi:MAG: hypothetical protein KDD69_00135 [Bdellovibrionales bacterium]|nr:hypothetical protein [Bdellovibrionales bacterium]
MAFFGRFETGYDKFLWKQVADAGHYGIFFLATAYLCLEGHVARWKTEKVVLFAGALGIGLATAVELIQPYFDRSASGVDLINGIMAVLTVIWGYTRFARHPRLSAFAAPLGVAVLLQLFALLPAWQATAAIRWRLERFPVIAEFDSLEEHYLWEPMRSDRNKTPAAVALTTELGSTAQTALKVVTVPGTWSGVRYAAGGLSWSGHRTLRIRLYNPSDEILPLAFRVDDELPRDEYEDRFTKSLDVAPGLNDFVLPLAEIERAPNGRTLNLGNVVFVYFFVNKSSPSRTFYIDHLGLE